MATRAFIGAKFDEEFNGNGEEIVASYCHYDGYASGVGYTLFTGYTDDDAFKVADHGYLSCLPEPDKFDEYQHANHDDCSYYANEYRFIEAAIETGCEYVYLWKDNAWYIGQIDFNSNVDEVTLEKFDPKAHCVAEWENTLEYLSNNNPNGIYDDHIEETKQLLATYA